MVNTERDRVRVADRAGHNVAQRQRKAADAEVKRFADTANVRGGETWGNASGHSGTRAAWIASGVIVAGFILGGVGLTVGPRLLIWIGVGIIVVVGAFGLATHVWSDYLPESEVGELEDGEAEGSEPDGRESQAVEPDGRESHAVESVESTNSTGATD